MSFSFGPKKEADYSRWDKLKVKLGGKVTGLDHYKMSHGHDSDGSIYQMSLSELEIYMGKIQGDLKLWINAKHLIQTEFRFTKTITRQDMEFLIDHVVDPAERYDRELEIKVLRLINDRKQPKKFRKFKREESQSGDSSLGEIDQLEK